VISNRSTVYLFVASSRDIVREDRDLSKLGIINIWTPEQPCSITDPTICRHIQRDRASPYGWLLKSRVSEQSLLEDHVRDIVEILRSVGSRIRKDGAELECLAVEKVVQGGTCPQQWEAGWFAQFAELGVAVAICVEFLSPDSEEV